MKQRGINKEDVEDALINPLYVRDTKLDSKGQPSDRYIREKATVNIKPETGVIIIVWKTGKRLIKKYRK